MHSLNEVENLRELELHKIIRERESKIAYLEEEVAKYKLGNDKQVLLVERLEMELLDRDECIYNLNKQCFSYRQEIKEQQKTTNDFAIYTMKETIDLQQKEIEKLKSKLSEGVLLKKAG